MRVVTAIVAVILAVVLLYPLWLRMMRRLSQSDLFISGAIYLACLCVRVGTSVLLFVRGRLIRKIRDFDCVVTMLAAASRWRWDDIRAFIQRMRGMQELPTIKGGMAQIGMRSIYEWYWYRGSLLKHAKSAMHPLQKPLIYIPGLAPVMFYDRKDFAWVKEVESAASLVREELLQLLAARTGFQPYLNETGASHHPFAKMQDQGLTKYQSGRWNVFYLYRCGVLDAANAAHCPQTLRVLNSIPGLDTTLIMFSALSAKTWIPPHFGLSNALLRVHLPLIVPPHSEIRVGTEKQSWKQDEILIFDDSFEHEVWNHADDLRVVLFFNVFHPSLTQREVAWLKQFLYQDVPNIPLAQYWNRVQETAAANAEIGRFQQHLRD